MQHEHYEFTLNALLSTRAAVLSSTNVHRFGGNVEWVHCINMMPFTPISEELLSFDYVQQEWPVLATAFDR